MTLDLTLRYPGRYGAKTSEYPQGKFENETSLGANDKSYLEVDWTNDLYGFLGAILNDAGESPNNVIDTGDASQLFDALVKSMRKNLGPPEYVATLDFSSGSSWSKVTGFTWFRVTKYGGGGGGEGALFDSGKRVTGGGGGGGQKIVTYYRSDDLPSSVPFQLGAGGAGGISPPSGAVAASGGSTTFNGEFPAVGGLAAGRRFLVNPEHPWQGGGGGAAAGVYENSESVSGRSGRNGSVADDTENVRFLTTAKGGISHYPSGGNGYGGDGGIFSADGSFASNGSSGGQGVIIIEGIR